MIKILIVDDHQMFIDGIYSIFSTSDEVKVIGHCINGKEVLKLLAVDKPDVLLLDVNMPDSNGLKTCINIQSKYPEIPILVLSMYNTQEIVMSLFRAGAKGYILKNSSKIELLEAIKTVHNKMNYIGVSIDLALINNSSFEKNIMLSEREIEIVRLIAKGHSNESIADLLFLSIHTIKTHRKNMLSKLNFNSTAELIKYCSDMGLL
ncbi:MAG: response regulator [Bacteroidia bacterium]